VYLIIVIVAPLSNRSETSIYKVVMYGMFALLITLHNTNAAKGIYIIGGPRGFCCCLFCLRHPVPSTLAQQEGQLLSESFFSPCSLPMQAVGWGGGGGLG
jgi:hypothetical protein